MVWITERGGSIEALSDGLNRGTTFLVHLPVSMDTSEEHLSETDSEVARETGSPEPDQFLSTNVPSMRT